MFEEDDLVFDQRTLEGLGNLYNSLVRPPVSCEIDVAMVYQEFAGVEED
jgi:hypothetical protein